MKTCSDCNKELPAPWGYWTIPPDAAILCGGCHSKWMKANGHSFDNIKLPNLFPARADIKEPFILVYGNALDFLGPNLKGFETIREAKAYLKAQFLKTDGATGGHVENQTGKIEAGPWHKSDVFTGKEQPKKK